MKLMISEAMVVKYEVHIVTLLHNLCADVIYDIQHFTMLSDPIELSCHYLQTSLIMSS